MDNLAKHRLLNVAYTCYSRVKLPFFRKILIGPNLNWFGLNYSALAIRAILKGYQLIFLKNSNHPGKSEYVYTLEPDKLSNITHKGVNLFEIVQYQICVELQTFITDIDLAERTHLAVIEKWFQKAASFIDYVTPYFNKNRLFKAIILQGYLYEHAIIRWICIDRKIEVLAVENTFNKDKIIWDNVSGISVNRNLARNYFWRYERIVDNEKSTKYTKSFIADIKRFKQTEHKSPGREFSLTLQNKTIFYIGQVYTDSSTLFGINDFHSPISIIEALVNYSLKRNCTLLIKLHPKEIAGYDICNTPYDSLTHRKVRANVELYDRIMESENIIYDYNNDFDTYSIIRVSDICVTINSQAGLESTLLGKRVITCGNAFYDCLGHVYPARNKVILISLLDSLLAEDFEDINMDEIYAFFYIFCEKYCIPKNSASFVKLFAKLI